MDISVRDRGLIAALALIPDGARVEVLEEALRCFLATPYGLSVFNLLRSDRQEFSLVELLARAAAHQCSGMPVTAAAPSAAAPSAATPSAAAPSATVHPRTADATPAAGRTRRPVVPQPALFDEVPAAEGGESATDILGGFG